MVFSATNKINPGTFFAPLCNGANRVSRDSATNGSRMATGTFTLLKLFILAKKIFSRNINILNLFTRIFVCAEYRILLCSGQRKGTPCELRIRVNGCLWHRSRVNTIFCFVFFLLNLRKRSLAKVRVNILVEVLLIEWIDWCNRSEYNILFQSNKTYYQ